MLEPITHTSSQHYIQWLQVSSQKSTLMGLFMPQKSANTTNQGFSP